jgi:hypothetical protein
MDIAKLSSNSMEEPISNSLKTCAITKEKKKKNLCYLKWQFDLRIYLRFFQNKIGVVQPSPTFSLFYLFIRLVFFLINNYKG